MQQVGLVQQKRRMHVITAELLDVATDRVEDRGRGRLGREPERQAQLAIEVAAPERRVVGIRQPKARVGQSMTQRPERARLAHAGFAHEQDVLVRVHGLDEFVDEQRLARGQPQFLVRQVLVEGHRIEIEVPQIRRRCGGGGRRRFHCAPPGGLRPSIFWMRI